MRTRSDAVQEDRFGPDEKAGLEFERLNSDSDAAERGIRA